MVFRMLSLLAVSTFLLVSATSAQASPIDNVSISDQDMVSAKTAPINDSSPMRGDSEGTILTAYLTEDFEGGVIPPSGWTLIDNNTYTWEIDFNSPYEGSFMASCFYDPGLVQQDERLITPTLDFSNATSELRTEFYWLMSYYWGVDPYDNYDLEVLISTDGGSTFPTMLWTEDSVGVFDNWTWYLATVDLSGYIGESTVVLAWKYYGVDGAQSSIDLIKVTDDPSAAVDEEIVPHPGDFALFRSYPNPFNASAVIDYVLESENYVDVSMYNVIGQKVETLFEGTQQAGEHSVSWNASVFPSGVYFARLQTPDRSESIRMVLLK